MDGKSGWHSAHKPGDLVRLTKKNTISMHDKSTKVGDLGVIVSVPLSSNNPLFFEVYLFRGSCLRWVTTSEIDIISNIDD